MQVNKVKQAINHRNIFYFGLVLMLVGLPLSKFLISLGQFVLLGNWIAEWNFPQKWIQIKKSKALHVIFAFFLLHLLGLLYTEDIKFALNDIKIKLPLLWLPLLLATTKPLNSDEIKKLMYVFITANLVASIISVFVLLGYSRKKVLDIRDISIFQSHIRFALMIVICILFLMKNFFSDPSRKARFIKALVIFWLTLFLMIMQTMSGIIILAFAILVMGLIYLFSKRKLWIKLLASSLIVVVVLFSVYSVRKEWRSLTYEKQVNINELPTKTVNGNPYFHDNRNTEYENGNPVWFSNCYIELERSWNKRSSILFENGKDAKNNPIGFTLIRYMSSMGLTKDSIGMSKLSNNDIALVEKGTTNYLYPALGGLDTRIHEVLWELNRYRKGDNPSGHSLTMRLAFWRAGWEIVKQNPLIGVGTGDAQLAYNSQYETQKSTLTSRWRLRSHNQFLAITVSFGLIGLLIFLCYLFLPPLLNKQAHPFLIWVMFVMVLSMMNEDTLETQAGATLQALFVSLFLFAEVKESIRFKDTV